MFAKRLIARVVFTAFMVASLFFSSLWITPVYAGSMTVNTQIRLRFKLDDNNNLVANYLKLYSGNAALENQPLLLVEYTAP